MTEYYFETVKYQKRFNVLAYERDSPNECTKESWLSKFILHSKMGPFSFLDKANGIFGPSVLFSLLQKRDRIDSLLKLEKVT